MTSIQRPSATLALASVLALLTLSVAASAQESLGTRSLPERLDRVREAKGLLIAAHRGGPAPGYPENALETLQYGLEQGIGVFEVDVAESQDGVLYLMHDRSLRRTGGHDGGVADTDWAVVSALDLLDPEGKPTGFSPPKLADVLRWARGSGAILELDRKETTSFRNIIAQVRAEKAEDSVLVIAYSDEEAAQIARLAPELMLTTSVKDAAHRGRLTEAGVDLTHVVAWLGTRDPNLAAMGELGAAGIESAFGTLGRPGRRLDDVYVADGDAAEYQALVDGGLTLLATDRPYFVARQLSADDVALRVLKGLPALRTRVGFDSEPSAAYFISDAVKYIRNTNSNRVLSLSVVESWPGQPECSTELRAASSFDIRFAAPRTPTDWLVIGEADDRAGVLERWTFSQPAGSVAATRPVADVPIGTPYAHVPTTIGPVGGVFVPLAEREAPAVEQRTLLTRDLRVTPISSVVADPDGRFLIYASAWPGRIFRREIAAGASDELVIDRETAPLLADNVVSATYIKQHRTLGRCYAFSVGSEYVVGVDTDNDGVFDDVIEMTAKKYEDTFLGRDLIENFHDY